MFPQEVEGSLFLRDFLPNDPSQQPASLAALSPPVTSCHQKPWPPGMFIEFINSEMCLWKEWHYLKSLMGHRWSMSVCLFLITDLANLSLSKKDLDDGSEDLSKWRGKPLFLPTAQIYENCQPAV